MFGNCKLLSLFFSNCPKSRYSKIISPKNVGSPTYSSEGCWEAGDGLMDTRYILSHPAPTTNTFLNRGGIVLQQEMVKDCLDLRIAYPEDIPGKLPPHPSYHSGTFKVLIQVQPGPSVRNCNSELFVGFIQFGQTTLKYSGICMSSSTRQECK